MVTIEVRGLDRVIKKLDKTASRENIAKAEKLYATAMMNEALPYPARPAASTYQRTSNLANKWSVKQSSQLTTSIKNTADYAGWVQGPIQTKLHQATGWKRIDKLVTDNIDKFKKIYLEQVKKIWRS